MRRARLQLGSSGRCAAGAALLCLLCAATAGCQRAHYRTQADEEVYGLVRRGSDPRWRLSDYTIQPRGESRFYDPDNPDTPPMPPDDPSAHQLMHCVYCKKGWPCWHACGDTKCVESPTWRMFLPYDEHGELTLDREGAVRLALLHSREYQQELEDLYLSALEVTFQRFRFDVQFFAGHATTFTSDGPLRPGTVGSRLNVENGGSVLDTSNQLGFDPTGTVAAEARRYLATGGELVVGVANSLVWQFAGPDQYSATTLLDFSMVQPLLRAGGRAVALEQLTQSERTLLCNIRQMERYRQAFYAQLLNGRNPQPGPSPDGNPINSLAPITLTTTGTSGVTATLSGGLLGLLSEEQSIRNQRSNLVALRDAVDRLQQNFVANRIDRFQVDLARQALLNAQSRLLGLEKIHQDRLDAYNVLLGLPPELKTRLEDPLLKRFNMTDPELTDVQQRLDDCLDKIRNESDEKKPVDLQALLAWTRELAAIHAQVIKCTATVERDMDRLQAAVPARRKTLARLSRRPEAKECESDAEVLSPRMFDVRLERLQSGQQELMGLIAAALGKLAKLEATPIGADTPQAEAKKLRAALDDAGSELSTHLTDLSLIQLRARLDAFDLVPIEMEPDDALEIARTNRLDWMNARTALVDQWREIEIRANALKANLNLVFSGDVSTTGNNPLKFNSATGRLRGGVQFEAPLTRLVERNVYRATLIEYQRARRAYYALEDRVNQGLRNTLRTIRLDQVNLELRREAVVLAALQVETTQLRLLKPSKSVQEPPLGATTARDLVQAIQELLNAQDGFISVWIDYESQRLNLDLDLGTMRLDPQGQWLDPGAVEPGTPPAPATEEIPTPEPLLKQLGEVER